MELVQLDDPIFVDLLMSKSSSQPDAPLDIALS